MTENPYATPKDTSDKKSGLRRIGGLIWITIGALLAARVLWLRAFVFDWAMAGAETKNRFVIMLCLCAIAIVCGCWAAFGIRRAAWALGVLILLGTVAVALN